MLAGASIRQWQGLAPSCHWSSHTSRRRQAQGINLALRGFNVSEFRLLLRRARSLKWFAGYTKSSNSFVDVENEEFNLDMDCGKNGASRSLSVYPGGTEASPRVFHGQNVAVDSVLLQSSENRLNGLPIVDQYFDRCEGRNVAGIEKGESGILANEDLVKPLNTVVDVAYDCKDRSDDVEVDSFGKTGHSDGSVSVTETAELLSSNGLSRLENSNSNYSNYEVTGVASLDSLRVDGQVSRITSTENGHGTAAAAPPIQAGSDDLEYYVPVIGHRVLGVVVSGSRTKFDVDIGAAKLGELKVSKLFPLDRVQVKHNKYVCPDEADAESAREKFFRPPHGRPCMVYDEEVFAYDDPAPFIIDIGTVLELVVIGKSFSGNHILSARKAAERIAWDRVKQIKELKQPIQVEVIDCNTIGVVAKVEGLRAFLPLKDFINRPKTLEDYMGRKLWVTITFADENNHNLVISERKAWVKRNLQPGSLHDGTVIGILPYGVRVQVNRTNIMGLIHISNIAHALIEKVTDVFEIGEQIKMMVVNSRALNSISFSTADLESGKGLMLTDKQRVFQEAERNAHAWWITHRRSKEFQKNDAEAVSYQAAQEPIANLDWLDFGERRVSLLKCR